MLSSFDWLRLCRSGAELMATLRCLKELPALATQQEIGSPHSALSGPCLRCWIYRRTTFATGESRYCGFCHAINGRIRGFANFARHSVVIWGYISRAPLQLFDREPGQPNRRSDFYVHEENRFLLMMAKRELKLWLQELILYHGLDLYGLLQIFPATAARTSLTMGDLLCLAVHHEADLSMNRLRVRFYSSPYHMIRPRIRDREGLLTFEISEFIGLLEMAEVFCTILKPWEQKELLDLLRIGDPLQEQFYWGRFLGGLNQQAKDMLASWRIRQWPANRIRLLYELVDYADLHQIP